MAISAANIVKLGIGAEVGILGGAQTLNTLQSDISSLINSNGSPSSNITFPSDLIQPNIANFYIDFKFAQYQKRAVNSQPFYKYQDGLKLPLPTQLHDDTRVHYDTPTMDGVVGAAMESYLAAGGATGLAAANNIKGVADTVKNNISSIAAEGTTAAVVSKLGSSFGGALDVASAITGLAVNPYQSMLFKSPTFKSHMFSWNLVPRNAAESDIIKNVINLFKFNMLPGVSSGNAFLFSFPNIVYVNLYPNDEYLYRFKPCIIDNVVVEYAIGNAPAFYRGTNAPTMVKLSVSLKEIEYWTQKDIYSTNTVSPVQYQDTPAIQSAINNISSSQ